MFQLPAAQIGGNLAAELARLLSLAFTDQRHLDLYAAEERAAWLAEAEALHAGQGQAMPAEWLRRFPSLQNLKHPPERRVPSLHLFDRRGVVLAGHVALCEQDMRVGEAAIRGAYVEDVATHPAMLGRGIASRLLRAAVDVACRDGCDIGALGTGIPGFYERLGWRRWTGPATYLSSQGEITTDAGTMVLAITQRGAELLHAPAGTSLHVGRRLA